MSKLLDKKNRIIDSRAKLYEKALLRWMLRKARVEADKVIKRELGVVQKDDRSDEVDKELLDIITRFGIAQANDAAISITTSNANWLVNPQQVKQELESKEFKLKLFQEVQGWNEKRAQQISKDTKDMIKKSVSDLISSSLDEDPRPSVGEVARRIRTQFHGEDLSGRIYAFSPERAAVIARTELVQAENTGTFKAYEAAKVKSIKWLAYGDGLSGDRHHEKMNNVEIKLGEYFLTPLGNKLRYPGDPEAPIKETAQCRCSLYVSEVGD